MKKSILVPSPGESITTVEIGKWLIENGKIVTKGSEIAEIESDKATLPIIADIDGKLEYSLSEGDTIEVGKEICTIDDSFSLSNNKEITVDSKELKTESPSIIDPSHSNQNSNTRSKDNIKISPLAKELMKEHSLSIEKVLEGIQRISRKDIELVIDHNNNNLSKEQTLEQPYSKERISSLRKKLSQRLVSVKQETAMLTTFNEVDMSHVMSLRKKYQNRFIEQHGIKLGIMGFFIKAVSKAFKDYPIINAMINEEEIIKYNTSNISIAVQSSKGLITPVIKSCEQKSLAEIEKEIKDFGIRAKKNKIRLEELQEGTFTITNGGTFGSLLSTPIINPPQSAILGMHNIVKRPVAVNDNVEIHPMMYIALSYDHRLIDGKDSVGFLVAIKKYIENPILMLIEEDPYKQLLEI